MRRPSPGDVAIALGYVRKPKESRSDDETWYLNQFVTQFLAPDDDMDPSAHAAALMDTPDLPEIYQRLTREGTLKITWDEVPGAQVAAAPQDDAPGNVYELVEEPSDTEARAAAALAGGDTPPARSLEDYGITDDDSYTRTVGKILDKRGVSEEEQDRQLGQHAASLTRGSESVDWARKVARRTLFAGAVLVAGAASCEAVSAIRSGRKTVDDVENIQKDTGDAFDNIHKDPIKTTIPRTSDKTKKDEPKAVKQR